MEALAEIGLAADLEHSRNAERIAEYRVKTTTALIINGNPSLREKSQNHTFIFQHVNEFKFIQAASDTLKVSLRSIASSPRSF